MGVGGRGPPALPETPGFSGGKGHQGGTEPQAGQGGHQMSCLVCQRPKSHPRGHQGPGEGDPQLLPRNEKRTLGQGGFWGVSGREQEPSTGGDTDNLSCYFVVIWTQVAPVAQSEAGQGVGGALGRGHQAKISAGLKKGAVVTAGRGQKAATGARGLEKELREGPGLTSSH